LKKIIFLLLALLFVFTSAAPGFLLTSASYYDMDTRRFDVSIRVLDNNVYDITETVVVNFNVDKRGIFRYIPYRGKVVRLVDGKEVRQNYRNTISGARVEGYEYKTFKENGNYVIQIGSENRYLRGEHTYVIHYKCTLLDDKIPQFDDVYWNVLPLDWESPIENSRITVMMPKDFDASQVEFIGGAYGQTRTDMVDFSVKDNVITGRLKETLPTGEGVTLKVNLPEGYFTGEKTEKPVIVAMYALMALSSAAVLALWILFGRDEKIIPVVSFQPPEGMTSAETGYIIDGTVDNKDLISLIIYWASKGYIAINQLDKNDFELIKKKELGRKRKRSS